MNTVRITADGGDLAAEVRSARAGSVTVTIPSTLDPLAQVIACAAIGPLAIERAPGVRVNAVKAGPDADPAAVEAMIVFVEQAWSTTGQVIAVD